VATQTIVILDFGSQYTQLIARRIREQNVFSVVLPCTAPLAEIKALHPLGLILSGGPSSVYDSDAPAADPKLLDLGVPVLGICYGLHFIVHHLGGKVLSAPRREYGHAEVSIEDDTTPLFAGLPPTLQVWMSHGDEALELPAGFHRIAVSANALAGIANQQRRIWAVQFHPEVHHTPLGSRIIKNFVFQICGAAGDWTPAHFIETTVALSARKSARATSSAGSPAAWIHPSRQCWYTGPSAASSPASSSTTASCAKMNFKVSRRICATTSA